MMITWPELTQPGEEVAGAEVGLDRVGDHLELLERDAVRLGSLDPAVHQLREVTQLAGGQRQLGHAEVLAHDGPDLGSEAAFEVQGEDHEPHRVTRPSPTAPVDGAARLPNKIR
jgi:hypothetical protein